MVTNGRSETPLPLGRSVAVAVCAVVTAPPRSAETTDARTAALENASPGGKGEGASDFATTSSHTAQLLDEACGFVRRCEFA